MSCISNLQTFCWNLYVLMLLSNTSMWNSPVFDFFSTLIVSYRRLNGFLMYCRWCILCLTKIIEKNTEKIDSIYTIIWSGRQDLSSAVFCLLSLSINLSGCGSRHLKKGSWGVKGGGVSWINLTYMYIENQTRINYTAVSPFFSSLSFFVWLF